MNILFVMEHRVNAGNTHAVATYSRVAEQFGHTIAFYGPHQAGMAGAKFSVDPRAFDRVIYLIESKLYRVSRLMEVAMLASVPRARRWVRVTHACCAFQTSGGIVQIAKPPSSE